MREARENQLKTQLALAQFHALRAQLHPHFLFNALNAISSLIHSDPARADRMLARASELLRIAIDTAVKPEIPLAHEVEFAKRYLEIERMRYGDRLDVRVDIASETAQALVPNMLLQPLIENAVRHGVAPHAAAGRVEVRAARVGNDLSIVVSDTGDGFDPDDSATHTTRATLPASEFRRHARDCTRSTDRHSSWRSPMSPAGLRRGSHCPSARTGPHREHPTSWLSTTSRSAATASRRCCER